MDEGRGILEYIYPFLSNLIHISGVKTNSSKLTILKIRAG